MVRMSLDEIREDMILAESIFLPTGELLLGAGYPIKQRYISRLDELGYQNVMIEVEGTEDVKPASTISEQLQRDVLRNLTSTSREAQRTFDQLRRKGITTVRDIIRQSRKEIGRFIMNRGLASTLEQIIEEILRQNAVVLNLSALDSTSESLFTHSLNVTITSLCIGRKYHLSYEEMKQLAVGALNFDIGLISVSREIMEKNEPLTTQEELQLKQHTINGYLILSKNQAISPNSAAAALQHHEHQDGSGYPRGIRGENGPPLKDFKRKNLIHRFSEIIAVADCYDMMTNGRRHYSGKYTVQEAIRKIIQMGGDILNSEIVKTLVSIVPVFPVGARVRFIDAPTNQLVGYLGVVARDNPDDIEKPQIVLYETRNHYRLDKPILVDLAKHTGFTMELVA